MPRERSYDANARRAAKGNAALGDAAKRDVPFRSAWQKKAPNVRLSSKSGEVMAKTAFKCAAVSKNDDLAAEVAAKCAFSRVPKRTFGKITLQMRNFEGHSCQASACLDLFSATRSSFFEAAAHLNAVLTKSLSSSETTRI